MATIQLYRTDLSLFAAAVSAVANMTPVAPTLATANTTSASLAAVYVTDAAGSFFLVSGSGLAYNATTGRLTGGFATSIEYHGFAAGGGSFAVVSTFVQVSALITAAGQADPVNALFGAGSNAITADTAALTATAAKDVITVGGTIPGRVDGGAGIDTAVFRALRGDATVSGGGGAETVTVANITTSLVSVERLEFLDGSVIENASLTQGQAVLAFKGILGRLPDAINAGGDALLATQLGLGTVTVQLLATPEGQAATGNLDNGQFVTRIYQNVLNRLPTASELALYQAPLDAGRTVRGVTVANIVTLAEAATVNAGVFATGIFAASPGAVDTLRAYEVLLGRLPEASSLGANAAALDQFILNPFSVGNAIKSLPDLYRTIQTSVEFAARTTPNPYGITAGSSFGAVFAATHSDALTATNTGLITAAGGIPHLAG